MIYLSCDNKYIGSFLFSIALFVICILQLNLFTGKIGFIERKNAKNIILILIVNIISCIILGYIFSYFFKLNNNNILAEIVNKKFSLYWYENLFRSFCCGIIMFIAVKIFLEYKNPLGIFIGIPVFILAGFEHSIANTFYLAAANQIFTITGIKVITINIIGNSLGSIFFKILLKKE